MKDEKMIKDKLSEYLKWSAFQMKVAAEKTYDPTLKTKYEQIAGINREYEEKCGDKSEPKNSDNKLKKEIDLLKSAMFCQRAICSEFYSASLGANSAIIDEVLDRQKQIVRDLNTEIEKREAIL